MTIQEKVQLVQEHTSLLPAHNKGFAASRESVSAAQRPWLPHYLKQTRGSVDPAQSPANGYPLVASGLS